MNNTNVIRAPRDFNKQTFRCRVVEPFNQLYLRVFDFSLRDMRVGIMDENIMISMFNKAGQGRKERYQRQICQREYDHKRRNQTEQRENSVSCKACIFTAPKNCIKILTQYEHCHKQGKTIRRGA